MKKNLKVFVALALVLSIALCLVACGGSSVAGKYTLVSMEMEGMTIEGEMLESMGGEMYLVLKKDGTGTMSLMGEKAEMEYKNGKIWPVDEPDEKVAFTVKGDKLTMEIEGTKVVFEK